MLHIHHVPSSPAPEDSVPYTRTHYTVDSTDTKTTTATVDGHHVDFTTDSDVTSETSGEFDSRVMSLITREDQQRQRLEDARSIKRNRNRMLSLLVVLAMELVIPTMAAWGLVPIVLVRYEVLLITAPDIVLTVYAWIRRY